MNIIIIGSQGFIGGQLCNYFLRKGDEVYGADILESPPGLKYHYIKVSRLSSQWEDLLKLTDFDICINAAGSGNVSYSVTHPLIDFEANTLDVIRILDAIRKYQPSCKYLHISSAAVYGNPVALPVKESASLNPISPYGYHKKMSEILCKEYHDLYGISLTIIRPFSIFGNGLQKQLLWDTCNKLRDNNNTILYGTGDETRDFIHISDFVLLVDMLLEKSAFKAEIYNVASGIEISVKQIASIFEKNYGVNKKINFSGETKPGDPLHWRADISEIKKLGFQPKADFETSVNDYINWFDKLHANS